jgi:DNA-binding NarL/FixJ family response regulator
LITGEAGVGKSRLVAEAKTHAANLGFAVVQGVCFQADSASPYAPLLDLLRSYFANWPNAAIRADLGSSAALLAPLLPDLMPQPVDQPSRPLLDLAQEKHQLIAAFTHFFLRQSAQQPQVIVIEDLHWSDESSLECLYHLARRSSQHAVVLILTYRNDELHPRLRHWLAQLDRERLAQELILHPLSRSEVEAMLRAIFELARPVRVEFLEAIYALTEGNPFFVEEVLTSLLAAGDIFQSEGTWDRKPLADLRIPRSVQDAVQQRAARLSDAAQHLLSLAAVMGRRFDFGLLLALTHQDESQLLTLLKELIATGLVIEESRDHFAFRHALTRQAIYAELLGRESRAMHLLIAETIERHYAAALDSWLPDLAHHYYQAGHWEQAQAFSQRAGERALALHAPWAAIEHFTHTLESAQHLGIAAPLEALHLRGRAYEWGGDFDAARLDFETTLAQARAAQAHPMEWQALIDLGQLWDGRDYQSSRDYYQQARELAAILNQPTLLAHSLNRLGNWYTNADQPQAAQRYHQQALEIFQAVEDRPGLAATLDLLGVAAIISGDLAQTVTHYRQAVRLYQELDDRRGLVAALATLTCGGGILHSNTVVPVLSSAAAVRDGELAQTIARESGWRAGEAFALTLLAMHLATRGEYGQALALVENALATALEIDHRAWASQAHHAFGGIYLDLLALPLAQQHLEQALALAQGLSSMHRLRSVSGFLAAVYIAGGELARAESVLDAVLEGDTAMQTLGQRQCWCSKAELALGRGQPDQALLIADRLLASLPNLHSSLDAVPRLALLRGEALAAAARSVESEAAFQAACRGAIHQGTRPLQWRAHGALSRLYHAQKRHDAAATEFEHARQVIEELAATLPDDHQRQSFQSQAMAQLPQPPAPHRLEAEAWGGLSPREREVAMLVAQGKSNSEIAETLVVGKRTVETHVSNIFSKLGITNRAQLIAWVLAKEPPDTAQ